MYNHQRKPFTINSHCNETPSSKCPLTVDFQLIIACENFVYDLKRSYVPVTFIK